MLLSVLFSENSRIWEVSRISGASDSSALNWPTVPPPHVWDCLFSEASPYAAVGELGIGQGPQQLLSQPWSFTSKITLHMNMHELKCLFLYRTSPDFFASLCCLVIRASTSCSAHQTAKVLNKQIFSFSVPAAGIPI